MAECLVAFLLALLVGTLVEYWAHRMMHGWLLRKKHAEHHKEGVGQGWFWEFLDYFLPTLPLGAAGFLYSLEAGIGFAAGATFYAAFAAYAHQLQHEHPELCFWLVRPVHYLHHKNHMWKTNFGISIDLWDRVFGTYRRVEWQREQPFRFRGLFRIKWI
ncbi:MAG: sterol desaturase family protein [Planctomycetes bacterium]|nr:sterol desaturase family protein [Planctomycetota bacterium]